ncbi:MAG TPA: hypothetical protein VG389_24790 [Myxococcota bacterium]|jgi:hypothetical protein|nr:hypothetical protein [Myxococcota bacterium]
MYRDDTEAALRRAEILEQELAQARAGAAATDAARARLTVLEDELAAVHQGLAASVRRAGELQTHLAALRRLTGGAHADDPLPRAPQRMWIGMLLAVVLTAALLMLFVTSLSVAGDALRLFRRDTTPHAPPAPPPPLTEREIPGFPASVDADAVLYAVFRDYPGARPVFIEATGVAVDGFVDLGAGTGHVFRLELRDTRGRAVWVALDAAGLARHDGPADPADAAGEMPLCTTRVLWDAALASGAPADATGSFDYDAADNDAPWTLELDTGERFRLGADCRARPDERDRVYNDFPDPEGLEL